MYQGFCDHPDFAMVLESERYFLTLADQYQIEVYGSYDPALYHGASKDFTDGMHLKSSSIGKYYQLRP